MADEEAQGEAIPHIDTTEVIGDGWYPDEQRVLATWHVDTTHGNETPIRINHAGLRGELKPNTMTLMPESTAQMLIESGYDVEIQFNAIVNEGVDEEIEAAVAAIEGKQVKAKAKGNGKKKATKPEEPPAEPAAESPPADATEAEQTGEADNQTS